MDNKTALFWHRRDLRLTDNAALYHALKNQHKVIPVFIFDTEIISELPQNDQRMVFLHRVISQLKLHYRSLNSDLWIFHGNPAELIPKLMDQFGAAALYANRDYEPYAINRDKAIYNTLAEQGRTFSSYKDHVIFDRSEVVKSDGKPYTIYTPYAKRWKEKLNDFYLKSFPVEAYRTNLSNEIQEEAMPDLARLGFSDQQLVDFPSPEWQADLITKYHLNRDFPAVNATSRLSLHLRFGTISIRTLARETQMLNEKFFNELIWRDFYQMILYHFPQSVEQSFKPAYDNIRWESNEQHFRCWCEGKTGYPLVDAGMRELNETGFMHNRVRMVVASFLCKHLLIDWRWGEAYFAEKLLDFDLASNVGGWQWASGSGCDAAPYFRVFNPELQQQRFDPEFAYIRKWLPEFGTDAYPKPIIEHVFARNRVIERYKEGLLKVS